MHILYNELSPQCESRLRCGRGTPAPAERKEFFFGYGSESLEIDTSPIEAGLGAADWYRGWCTSYIRFFLFFLSLVSTDSNFDLACHVFE